MRFATIGVTVAVLTVGHLPSKAQDVPAATSRVIDVQWPGGDAGAAPPFLESRLSKVNQTLLPVLIPRHFLKFKTFAFVGEELHYSASVLANGAKLSISGTRIAIDPPKGSRLPPERGQQITSEAGDGTSQATKVQYRAAYKVIVECEAEWDRRCVDARYARRLLSGAHLMGGGKDAPSNASEGEAAPLPPDQPFDKDFTFSPPGELTPGSGRGVVSTTVYTPDIRFPVEAGPAYLNSQVWNIGGNYGPKGSWRDKANYRYPWHDNFCESRARRTLACPSGTGHQGVDIRPADHRDATHWAVAVENGRITDVGIYTVTLVGRSGSEYRYLHMKMNRLAVQQGASVTRGQRIGLISNDFGGTPTPVHLHFELLQNVGGRGFHHVPPYTSLVRAYQGAK